MEIRPANTRDIRPLAELWAHAFPGERTVEQRVRQIEAGGVYGGIDNAWIAADDADRTVGAFRPYALQQHLHGTIVAMLGLAAVAVSASARRRGLGADMCRVALQHAYSRGDVISVLYPFRPSFYELLGWSLCGSLHAYLFRPESLRITHENPRVQLIANAADVIPVCYESVAARSNGMIVRTPRVWRQHLEWRDLQTFALIVGDTCRGYILACYTEGEADQERILTIREMIASDEDAYTELLSWISLQRDDVNGVSYDALPDEHFDLRLIEPRTPGVPAARTLFAQTARVIRGPMARLVNVRRAFESRTSWPVDNVEFTLTVTDGIIGQNNVALHIQIDCDGATVSVADAASESSTSIHADVGTFTQIYLGELTVSNAIRLGRARVNGDVKKLDATFRTEPAFVLLDEF